MAKDGAISKTELAGRFDFQKKQELNIISEVILKLSPNRTETLLEIGSGPGNISIPLAKFHYKSVTAIDSENVLKVLSKNDKDSIVRTIEGDWLNLDINDKYDHIIIYSVLHYMASEKLFLEFIDKAYNALKIGGKLLIGDLPNIDRKKYFTNSNQYDSVNKDWIKNACKLNDNYNSLFNDLSTLKINDNLINKVLNKFNSKISRAYLMPQLGDLPFCFTREDILILK